MAAWRCGGRAVGAGGRLEALEAGGWRKPFIFTILCKKKTWLNSFLSQFEVRGCLGKVPVREPSSSHCYARRRRRWTDSVTLGCVMSTFVLMLTTVWSTLVNAQQDMDAPTASIYAGPAFTAAHEITVQINFSKPCLRSNDQDGFQCNTTARCDLLVYGDGEAVPSSLQRHDTGMQYTILVNLSTSKQTGKVVLAMQKAFCSDRQGNLFQRAANSTAVIRFDRNPVTVLVWTPASASEVRINNQARTLEATSSAADLVIYLDFSSPVLNTSFQIASALQVPDGILIPIARGSQSNRRFAFQLETNLSSAVVTVALPVNSVYGRSGLAVQPASLTFLFDFVRPLVKLTTAAAAKTRARNFPILIEFNEPVFGFNSSGVIVTGGTMTSFTEQSKRSYTLQIHVAAEDVTSVLVAENVTADIAGNANLASSVMKVRHYDTPAISVAISSFITVGLIATALASGTLAISSASLAAAGALASRTAGCIGADPSRNLLGMASHVQVFALSHWLAVNLPIEYSETVRGLRWIIPNVQLPWEHGESDPSVPDSLYGQTPISQSDTPTSPGMLMEVKRFRVQGCWCCRLDLSVRDCMVNTSIELGNESSPQLVNSRPYLQGIPLIQSNFLSSEEGTKSSILRQERMLVANSSVFGPALVASEYELYFLNGTSAPELSLASPSTYTGWRDFGRNMFWLGAVGAFLVVAHVIVLLVLKWRTKTSVRGALSIPRFEFFLLILSLPGVCQASASLIRGGTPGGIVLGVLLLAVPLSFFLSVGLFLIVAIFSGALVQYEEFRNGIQEVAWYSRLLKQIAGENVISKWIRREGLAPAFLPRFGLLFEDRKGPPKVKTVHNAAAAPHFVESGVNGIGRMRAVHYSDDSETAGSTMREQILGAVRSAYILVDIARRILLGVVFGAYGRSARSWSQVSLVLGVTLLQLLTLLIFKPFVRRGVQVVESVSMICELAVFSASLVLLARDTPSSDNVGLGILMLVLVLTSFLFQLVNEWYALLNQLLKLVPSDDTSLKLGLKMVAKGLILLFLPRGRWHKLISPQVPQQKAVSIGVRAAAVPAARPVALTQGSHEPDTNPVAGVSMEAQPSAFTPGSPVFIDPRAVVSVDMGEDTGEIMVEVPWDTSGSRSDHQRKKRSRKSKSKRVSTDLEAAGQVDSQSVSEASKFREEGSNVPGQLLETSRRLS